MNRLRTQHHMVDFLFVLGLFFIFALSAFTVILIGVNVYKDTVSTMTTNYTSRTAVTYLTQKIRQNPGEVKVAPLPDGTPALILADGDTITTIYAHQDTLKEQNTPATQTFNPETGTDLLTITAFTPELKEEHLLKLTLRDGEGQTQCAYVEVNPQ